MRTEPPLLLPLFRSDGQGRLLARIYLEPDRPAPIAQLARELGLDAGGITREADRLEVAGIVRSERIGRSRILRPNRDSPIFGELHGLLLKTLGPVTVLAPELAKVEGIERAYLYGSWAARYQGELGPDPADVDVLVVGTPARRSLAQATRKLTEQLGREVNATIVSSERWEKGSDGFIRQVRKGPLVEVALAAPHGAGR